MKLYARILRIIVWCLITGVTVQAGQKEPQYLKYDLGYIYAQPFEIRIALRQLQNTLDEGEKLHLPLAFGFDKNRFNDEQDTEYFSLDSWNKLAQSSVLVALVVSHTIPTPPQREGRLHIGMYSAFDFIGWLTKLSDYGGKADVKDPITSAPLESDDIYFFMLTKEHLTFICTLNQLIAADPSGAELRSFFMTEAGDNADDLKNVLRIERIRVINRKVKEALPQASDFPEERQRTVRRKTERPQETEAELREKRKKAKALFAQREAKERGQVQRSLETLNQQLNTLSSFLR